MNRYCTDCGAGPMVRVKRWEPGLVRHAGRGLCASDYNARWKSGTHIDAPRRTRTLDELLEDYSTLVVREGCTTMTGLAAALQLEPSGLRRRLRQARHAGLYVPEPVDDYSRIRSQANRS